MNIAEAEEKVREGMEVHSVSDVDDLPFESYAEIQQLYRQGQLNLGCLLNENVVDNFGTIGQRVMDKILMGSPILAASAAIAVAVFRSEYILLWGILLAFFGLIMAAQPIMRGGKGFGGIVMLFALVAFVYFCIQSNFTTAFLIGTYLIPNFLLTVGREQNRIVMTEVIMSSEILFLYYWVLGNVIVAHK